MLRGHYGLSVMSAMEPLREALGKSPALLARIEKWKAGKEAFERSNEI
ncbi:hypothetical protein Mtc_2484 [Methanocella conradii HZ254]|uniref:Uncharacterized protein n=1 Tax=Methanocella conradii (strain DSM 24694 / JCM 17849 / CGMCC 1.5162 / HZ254) TaxID=1041930 RepID=H8I7J9_METCZ|nr:hypothetical protein Mtc_2484 [Methanocella conradii HZ254]